MEIYLDEFRKGGGGEEDRNLKLHLRYKFSKLNRMMTNDDKLQGTPERKVFIDCT